MNKKNEDFYNVKELADKFKVHVNTIYHAIRSGRIQAFKVGKGEKASWRIYKTEIERMAAFDARRMIDDIVQKEVDKKVKTIQLQMTKNGDANDYAA